MADDADVQAPDITPEDFDGVQDKPEAKAEPTPKTEPSPVKDEVKPESKEKPEVAKKDEAPAPPDLKPKAETEVEDETKVDPKTEETKAEEPPLSKAEERKTQLTTEIRDLVSQRNTLKAEVERINNEVYQPATEDELVNDGMSAIEAKVEAMRQANEVEKYNNRVADAQLTLSSESNRVLQDFPIFNPESDTYDKELADEAGALLSANLILDPNTNQVIGSNVSPYQLYKTLARASGISATKGQIKGQAATEQQLANVDAASSAAPPAKPKDPLADLWADPL
jgi:hypothetical protein